MGPRVLLAMSGGVDSSVAAYLLREQGYDVVGLFMRSGATAETTCEPVLPALPVVGLPPRRSNKQGCCSASDAADARRVADKLGIPFYAVDFANEFGDIMDYFVAEYTTGRTPNPCVMCNNWLKFGRLWDYAQQIGAEYIATGHYAQVMHCDDRPGDSTGHSPGALGPVPDSAGSKASNEYGIFRGADPSKDQSYVLYGIKREILPVLLFPVGGYAKGEIRGIARRLGLRVADKPDSQEICFVPDNDYQSFHPQPVARFRRSR